MKLDNIVIRVDNDKARDTPPPRPPSDDRPHTKPIPPQRIPLPAQPPDREPTSVKKGRYAPLLYVLVNVLQVRTYAKCFFCVNVNVYILS